VLERIIFLNEENHYTIAELRPETPSNPGTPDRRPDLITIIGPLPGVECGETLHLTGDWTRHSQHGDQFKIAGFKSELPASVYGIRKYLGSGLVPGIGKAYANKIVDAFGTDTFRILSEESGRLRDVEGIGKKRAGDIKRAWDGKRAERELYIFLQTYGVTTAQCTKLVTRYGDEAKLILQRDPYRVAREIDGIGFKTADRIAINIGFANDAPPRLDAGLIYSLESLQEEGHTAYPETDLKQHATDLLETSSALIAVRLAALVENGRVIRHAENDPLIQLPVFDNAEARIGGAVARLIKTASGLPPIKVAAAVEWAEKKAGFAFHELQRRGLMQALNSKVAILTGGPGTGKTTCLRALVDVLKAKQARVLLAAPTGRAAQRLAEATGGYASTIHRLLRFDAAAGGFTANESKPLAADFLIVDEASMLDARLAASLFSAIPPRAHLLLVGDTDQLPSVGAGNVLKDLIATERVPVTSLSEVFRQRGHSGIVATAHSINGGDPRSPPVYDDVAQIPEDQDLVFVSALTPEDSLSKILALYRDVIGKGGTRSWGVLARSAGGQARPEVSLHLDPIGDVQVLAPMHKGVAGVGNLNAQLQQALNPSGASAGVRGPSGEFRPGDKIIQLRNNYDKNLFNGDIGRVMAADPKDGTIDADFDGERHTFTRGEMGALSLAYAISIHKSQGSEYPVVIVPLLKAHFMMLQRNLLYTAITRGRRKVFLVGDPAAYAMAVRNNEARRRFTHLRQKILGFLARHEAL
jgi:exodeoxyribonuclease V alpha subunit